MKLQVRVVGIVRGVDPGFFSEAMSASFEAGLEAIEITMNTAGAEEIVAANRGSLPPGRMLGMGTVRTVEEAKRAIGAGAMFLVTPNTDWLVIEHGKAVGVPVVAGALTPTEVHTAWSAGAAMVKVFPCGALGGPRYIADLLGPFDRVSLMAVGGVNLSNIEEYFSAGADAVGASSSLFGREALRERDPSLVGDNVRSFLEHCPGSGEQRGPNRTNSKGVEDVSAGNQGH